MWAFKDGAMLLHTKVLDNCRKDTNIPLSHCQIIIVSNKSELLPIDAQKSNCSQASSKFCKQDCVKN